VFWVYLGLLALALAALPAIPETVPDPDRAFRVRLRAGAPAGMRAVMLGAGLGVFAAFTLFGVFSGLMPSFVRGVLGITNLAVIGATACLIFLAAAISQAISARLTSRRSVTTGLPLLCVGPVRGAAGRAGLFQGPLVTRLSLGGLAAELVQRGCLVESCGLTTPVAEVAVDGQGLLEVPAAPG
jgi:hypothetical protein